MARETGGRSSATLLWAAVAGILVLAFMVWLSLTSEPSVVAEIQEDTAAIPPPPGTSPPAPADSSDTSPPAPTDSSE